MRRDKANTLDCPFVARKCRAERCMAWKVVHVPQALTADATPEMKESPQILVDEEVCSLLK
jgi:hypothetical protein